MGKLRAGLVLQLFFFVLLPLAGLLLLVSFGSVIVHQNEMRRMVGERDELAARAAAETNQSSIDRHRRDLQALVLRVVESEKTPQDVLENSVVLFEEFSRGVALIQDGEMVASFNWAAELPEPNSFTPGILSTYQLVDGHVIAVSAETALDRKVTAVGAFDLTSLFENTFAQLMPIEPEIRVFIIDANHKVLYKDADLYFSGDPAAHPGVDEALSGKSGTLYIKDSGNEHVVAYAPIGGWALVMEEPWEAVVNPFLNSSQVSPLIMAPLLLAMLIALWFGARQIVQPLQKLETQTAKLAAGDFTGVDEPVDGIVEIRRLQTRLMTMAHQLEAAQNSLHIYIGAITTAQEDERRRLARDLHDDTLQSIIALKQRLQLAQMAIKNDMLKELTEFAEETIQNLRRMLRALRPIYLDDLGLVPALDVLAKETSQASLEVAFHAEGLARRLDVVSELALYRMAQEALNNVAKHARATQAHLTISFAESAVSLDVVDNGIGFDVPATPGAFAALGHFGILGLRERADLIRAKLVIESKPGIGTRVSILVHE